MNIEKELEQIHPLEDHVIISVIAKSHGTEEVSESGIVLGIRQQGELPMHGKIVKIGNGVEAPFLNKYVVIPQQIRNVPLPSVILGKAQSTKIDTKLVTCNYKAIQVLYSLEEENV